MKREKKGQGQRLRQPLKSSGGRRPAIISAGGNFVGSNLCFAGTQPGDKGVVFHGSILEHRWMFERPRFVREREPRVRRDFGAGRLEIGQMVRAEIETTALPQPFSEAVKKPALGDAMLMMPQFRPGIRKQYEHGGQRDRGRQYIEQKIRVGSDEMQICESGALLFSYGPCDPIACDINADTRLVAMGCGVGRQKMTVSAPDLQNESGRSANRGDHDWRELDPPFVEPREMPCLLPA